MLLTDIDILSFDLETTGKDAQKDWVVELGLTTFSKGVSGKGTRGLFNPGISIDPEAAEVHKITDDMVVEKPSFSTKLDGFRAYAKKFDLVIGYNCLGFDVPIVNRESERAGGSWIMEDDLKILDVKLFVDWHHRGERPRTQEAMAELYGLKFDGRAHSAAADTKMTGELMFAMVKAGKIPSDVDEALKLQQEYREIVEGEFAKWSYWVFRDRETSRLRMGAGKHCGKLLSDINKRTLSWYLNNIDDLTKDVRAAFEDARAGRFDNELQKSMVDVEEKAVDTEWGGW